MNITVLILLIVALALGFVYILDPELFTLKQLKRLPVDFACIHPASLRV